MLYHYRPRMLEASYRWGGRPLAWVLAAVVHLAPVAVLGPDHDPAVLRGVTQILNPKT